MAIGIYARLKIQEGKGEEFEKAFADIQAAVTSEEPGCNFYACHKTDDPTVYVVMEQYVDQEALDAHSKHLAEIGGALGGVMAGRPELEFFQSI